MGWRASLVVASLAASTAWTCARPALAEPPGPDALPIHVVHIRTDDADDQAEALTSALKAEVRKLRGWSLGDGDYSLEVLTLALKCPSPPDAACEQRIGDQIKAERYVWGVVKLAPGKRVEGTLRLWTRNQGESRTDIVFSDNLTEADDDALKKIVRDALSVLTGGPPKGSIRISAGKVNGQVFLDGEPAGEIRNGSGMVVAPIGNHKVEVRASGYATASSQVHVRPNAAVALTLNPTHAEQQRSTSDGPSARRLIGYSALLAGGAFAGATVYSWFKISEIESDEGFAAYRHGMKEGDDVCSKAKEGKTSLEPGAASPGEVVNLCSRADKFELLQYVFMGLGAVSLGTGAYLLLSGGGSAQERPATRVQLLPTINHRGGGGALSVRVSF